MISPKKKNDVDFPFTNMDCLSELATEKANMALNAL